MLKNALKKFLNCETTSNIVVKRVEFHDNNASDLCVIKGHSVVQDIRKCISLLESQYGLFTPDQKEASELALAACSRFIYKDVLDTKASEIFEHNGWSLQPDGTVPLGVFISGPRRLGKTHMFSFIMAAVLFSVPGVVVLGLAAEPRPAELLYEAVVEKVKTLISLTKRGKVGRQSVEHFYLEINDKVSKMHVLSARMGNG